MNDAIEYDEIKELLQCQSDHCRSMKKIMDTKSKNKYGFSYDCRKIKSLIYYDELSDSNATQSKQQKILSSKVSIPLQYIIICCIVLISLCILIISLKYTSKSKIHDAPLIINIENQ